MGTFVTSLIWRVPRKDIEHPAGPHCPSCLAPLRVRDSIPVVSWLLLKGRCRYGSERIPVWYPLVEVGTSVLFAGTALRFGLEPALPAYLILAAGFLALSVVDLHLRLLPNKLIYPTGFLAAPLLVVAALVMGEPLRLAGAAGGGLAVFGLFFLLHVVRPDGMAFGDVRLSFLVGMSVGWIAPSLVPVALLVAFLSSSVIGLAYGAATRRWLKATIPFGPFLAVGAEAAILASGWLQSPWALR